MTKFSLYDFVHRFGRHAGETLDDPLAGDFKADSRQSFSFGTTNNQLAVDKHAVTIEYHEFQNPNLTKSRPATVCYQPGNR